MLLLTQQGESENVNCQHRNSVSAVLAKNKLSTYPDNFWRFEPEVLKAQHCAKRIGAMSPKM
jgi:hypothetical protein